jgi:hypothetical protein
MSDQATDRQIVQQLNQLDAGRYLVCNVCHREHPRTEYAQRQGIISSVRVGGVRRYSYRALKMLVKA